MPNDNKLVINNFMYKYVIIICIYKHINLSIYIEEDKKINVFIHVLLKWCLWFYSAFMGIKTHHRNSSKNDTKNNITFNRISVYG